MQKLSFIFLLLIFTVALTVRCTLVQGIEGNIWRVDTSFPRPTNPYILNLLPDFERQNGALVGNKFYSFRKFDCTDIGKVIAVKKARLYKEFTLDTIAWNGYIIGIDTLTGAAILGGKLFGNPDAEMVNNYNTEALFGTNYFDAIQDGIDSALAQHKKNLLINTRGTIYVVPYLSAKFRNAGFDKKGWNITSPNPSQGGEQGSDTLCIVGLKESEEDGYVTTIKFGAEDMGTAEIYSSYDVKSPMLNYGARVQLQGMTWIAADRFSITNEGPTAIAAGGQIGVPTVRSIWVKNFYLKNGKDDRHGWKNGIYEVSQWASAGNTEANKLTVGLINSRIEAGNPITIFSPEGAIKKYYARNSTLVGAGTPNWSDIFYSPINIANGYLMVNDYRFSWYAWKCPDEGYLSRPMVLLFPKPNSDTAWLDFTLTADPVGHVPTLEILSPNGTNLMDGNFHVVSLAFAPTFTQITERMDINARVICNGKSITGAAYNYVYNDFKQFIDNDKPVVVWNENGHLRISISAAMYPAAYPTNRNTIALGNVGDN